MKHNDKPSPSKDRLLSDVRRWAEAFKKLYGEDPTPRDREQYFLGRIDGAKGCLENHK